MCELGITLVKVTFFCCKKILYGKTGTYWFFQVPFISGIFVQTFRYRLVVSGWFDHLIWTSHFHIFPPILAMIMNNECPLVSF